jgi:chemotaxis response regulator CheB
MLRRSDSPPQSSDEQTDSPGQPVRTVVVIGASAGGRAAIETVLKDLSHDIPAAIVVMLHVAPDSDFQSGSRSLDTLRFVRRGMASACGKEWCL